MVPLLAAPPERVPDQRLVGIEAVELRLRSGIPVIDRPAVGERDPDGDVGELAEDDRARSERCRRHGVERADPPEAGDDRKGRLTEARLHPGGRQQPGRKEREVGSRRQRAARTGLVHDPAEAEPHRRQEQDRLDERAEHIRAESPAIPEQVELEDVEPGRPVDVAVDARGGHAITR